MRLLILFILIFVSFPAWAGETPSQIVQNLYKPYLDDLQGKRISFLDAIYGYASHAMQKTIDKENECTKHEEMCALDSDILIAGQDGNINDFSMESENNQKSAIVRVYFKNGFPVRTNFMFVKENEAWKIDEIESLLYDEDKKLASVWKFKQGLDKWHAQYNK